MSRLVALLFLASLPVGQRAAEPVSPSEFDEVIELELTAESPTATAEYFVDFEGTLHVWVRSEVDVRVRVEDSLADADAVPAEAVRTARTGAPYVRLAVELNDELALTVEAVDAEDLGAVELHVVAGPETEATLAAVRAARGQLAEAQRLFGSGEYDAARASLGRANHRLTNAEGATHSEAVAAAAWDLGSAALLQMGAAATAEAALRTTRRHRERVLPPDASDLQEARANLAFAIRTGGDLDAALALEQAVLAARRRTLPEDSVDRTNAVTNMAITLATMGRIEEAHGHFLHVFDVLARTLPEGHPELLRARMNLASTLDDMGDVRAAHVHREAVVAAYEESRSDDDPELLDARMNLSTSLRMRGELQAARELLERVVESCERIYPEDHPRVLDARTNLARTLDDLGDTTGARALQESVLAVYERTYPADDPRAQRARVNLALLLSAQGDYPGARRLQDEALEVLERTHPGDHPDVLTTRLALATTLNRLGDSEGARALQEAVVTALERTLSADDRLLLIARENLANTLWWQGDLEGCRAMQESVLAHRMRTRAEDHPEVLRSRGSLASTLMNLGDSDGARALVLDQVAGLRRRALGLAVAPREARATLTVLADQLQQLSGIVDEGPMDLQRAVFELQETLRMIAVEAPRIVRSSKSPGVRTAMREVESVRAELGDVLSRRGGEDSSELTAEMTRLMRERDRLEREASLRLAEAGVVSRAIEIDALSEALGPRAAAVAFWRIEHQYQVNEAGEIVILERPESYLYAHVLRPDGSMERVFVGPTWALEELVDAWRPFASGAGARGVRMAGESSTETARSAGEELRLRLLDRILAVLPEEVERLHVCADDLVYLVPLDALPYGEGCVGDRWTIVNEVSFARLVAPTGRPATDPGLFLLGDVDYDARAMPGAGRPSPGAVLASRAGAYGSFSSLVGSRVEIEAMAELFRELFDAEPAIVSREDATKEALFEGAAGRRFVHLATHGWFAPDVLSPNGAREDGAGSEETSWSETGAAERVTDMAPMLLCGLALAGANGSTGATGHAGGVLTAEELCSLDLSACDLAVLSACETNVGIRRVGQGIQSLQAALYAAGARSSITSLWKVDDDATQRLMRRFYTNLWEGQMSKSDALWSAKRSLRDDGAPVSHWAGWVLTGDPD